ncbi:MAG: ATP-binding protein [Alphaproteobacteria bacterium]|nr:ATP-binding protein [Alphaproteobacteria bacterium]
MPNDSEQKKPGHSGDTPIASNGFVHVDDTAIATMIGAAQRFSENASLQVGVKGRFLIVIEEIVTNIVSHGQPPPGSDIAYRFSADETAITMTFDDTGVAFDPRRDSSDASSTNHQPFIESQTPHLVEGGHGWPLIHSWCRIVAYRRAKGRNHLELMMPLG